MISSPAFRLCRIDADWAERHHIRQLLLNGFEHGRQILNRLDRVCGYPRLRQHICVVDEIGRQRHAFIHGNAIDMSVHGSCLEDICAEVLLQDRRQLLAVLRQQLFKRGNLALGYIVGELAERSEDIHLLPALEGQIHLLGIVRRPEEAEVHLHSDLLRSDRINRIRYLAQIIGNPVEGRQGEYNFSRLRLGFPGRGVRGGCIGIAAAGGEQRTADNRGQQQ